MSLKVKKRSVLIKTCYPAYGRASWVSLTSEDRKLAVQEIIQLGDPALYKKAKEIRRTELPEIQRVVVDMHDTLMNFRLKHGFGRAIAAPQIGISMRLVYMFVEKPTVLINPVLTQLSRNKTELWDNCMSFPFLEVRVKRHASCTITYRDLQWNEVSERLDGHLSELLQHEVDHLNGILATQRAIDNRAFAIRR